MKNSYEEQLIKKIKGGIMGIKIGTKNPDEVIGWMNRLKIINKPFWEELMNDYKIAVTSRTQSHQIN